MKIQFITSAFNGMAQRLWIELDRLNHEVYVHIATTSERMIESVDSYQPHLIICPFLTVKIPHKIYSHYTCLIVHPGVKGDRGASSLDWAILNNQRTWGVTILQAVEKMDAGPIWSSQSFAMRDVSKGALYRNEVTQAASKAVLEAIVNFENTNFKPLPLDYSSQDILGKWNNKTTQKDFQFKWSDHAETIIRKINAADSSPGVLVNLFGREYFGYGAHLESNLQGATGTVLAQRDLAICIATSDAAVWITHLKSIERSSVKLPAITALGEIGKTIPKSLLNPLDDGSDATWREIFFEQVEDIGYLHFNFYNGAMSTDQCHRLRIAIIEAKSKVKLLVLMGGMDVWSNGIHLNVIENSNSPAEESWRNINAIDDLILEIINSTEHYIISALQGNAGAGGVSLALAGDKVIARNGVVLNPHTKNMGLFGSEYWTYLLPKRIGKQKAAKFTEECLPWGVSVAKEIGLIDDFYGETNKEFQDFVKEQAVSISNLSYFDKLLMAKKMQRRKDEMNKCLESYRKEELSKMRLNFYENNKGYNQRRFNFVHKIPNNDTEGIENLYQSRRLIYRKRKWENINYKERDD